MFWNIIIAIASYALQLALTPKPQNAKPKSLEDFQAPTAEEGREIPVVFGTVDIADPNVTWYGDLKRDAIKGARRYGLFGPRQVLGYKYSLGMQMGLCHGPADAIYSIRVGDKEAWKGIAAGGRISIRKGNLFGGDQSEGGISGDVDICMGAPDQLQNDYLVSKLGANISAFRGVVTAVLRQVYLGTSNYIKPWELRLQRIHKTSTGAVQWYDAKAAIPATELDTTTETGTSLSSGSSASFSGIDTNGDWAVIGAGTTAHVWNVTDGSHRSVTYSATLVLGGGTAFVTNDDEMVLRSGSSSTSLVFYDLADLTESQLPIALTPYWPPLVTQLNGGFAASEISVAGDKYLFLSVLPYTIGFRGPYLLLKKTGGGGAWAVDSNGFSDNATIPGYTEISLGARYAYLCGTNTGTIGLVDWTSGFAETLVVPPGIGSRKFRTATYVQATDEVFVVYDDGLLAVYNADLTVLVRSATPIASATLNNVHSLNNRSLVSGSTAILAQRDFSRIAKVHLVDLEDLSVSATIDIQPGSNYVNRTALNYDVAFNVANGGLFVAPLGSAGTFSFWPIVGKALDMNPAHIVRECLTDATWGMGYNDADMDDDTFRACADTFYGETFGLSLKWNREEEIEQFASTVLSHVDAFLYVSRSTGKFVLKAIRDDYNIDLIPVLTEDDVVEFTEVKRRQPSEASNSVLVKFYNRAKRKDAAHRVTNPAQSMQATKVLPTTKEYPGINTSALAIRVATRDVIALGSGLISGRIVANRRVESLNPGDPFRLVSSRHELSGQVMRVVDLGFGDGRSNKIGVKFFQDVFRLGASVLVDDSDPVWVPPSNDPLPVSPRVVQEMPYRELRQMVGDANLATMLVSDADAGLIQVAGSSPSPDAANASMQIDAGSGYSSVDVLDFAPGGFLDGDLPIDTTVLNVTGAIDLDAATLGTLAAIVGSTPGTTEIVRVDAIVGSTLTVARGCLDTVPREHASGASFVLFDDISNSDFEIYSAGDAVSVKLLTTTGQGTLELATAPTNTVTFDSRAVRPLRPADVQVEAAGYGPIEGAALTDFDVTWANRNRLTELLPVPAWTDADEAPESSQTTVIEVLDAAGASVVTTHSGLTGSSFTVPLASFGGNSSGFIRVGAERDGYREWQAHQIEVLVGYGLVLDGEQLTIDGVNLFLGA